MKSFITLTSVAVPLNIAKIDTGSILPGRFMRRHRRPGHDYAEAFLHDLRFVEHGKPRPAFVLNQPVYQGAKILVTGPDFGCGSSRDGAAYAVMDYGFRVLIGSSFADIFYYNCLQIGVLPVTLPDAAMETIWARLEAVPGAAMKVDLDRQFVLDPDGAEYGFQINPLRRKRLMLGQDDIDATLMHRGAIENFAAKRRDKLPWLPQSLRFMPESTPHE